MANAKEAKFELLLVFEIQVIEMADEFHLIDIKGINPMMKPVLLAIIQRIWSEHSFCLQSLL